MATIKAFTTIEQSRKLAEILPLESADMHYNNASIKGVNYIDEYRAELMDYNNAIKLLSKYKINPLFEIIPCWSLAALLEQLKSEIQLEKKQILFLHFNKYDDTDYEVRYTNSWTGEVLIAEADNPIDACYEMVLKLHELKLL